MKIEHSELGQLTMDLLDDPARWEFGEYKATHDSGFALWVGNGYTGFEVSRPSEFKFGWLEKIVIWRKVKWTMAKCVRMEAGVR